MSRPLKLLLPKLNKLLLEYEHIPVECDGHSLIVSHLLAHLDIPHQRMIGSVLLSSGQLIAPHLWIEIDEMRLDYRLRLWGQRTISDASELPHGLFNGEDFPSTIYNAKATVPFTPMSDDILNFMLDGDWLQLKEKAVHLIV